MNSKKVTMERVNTVRFISAKNSADYIVSHHDKDGAYIVDESWGPEGEIYRALCVWVLVDIYNLTERKEYINTAKKILNRFKKSQLTSGGWTISLGHDGLRFKITETEREDSNNQEDPVIAGAVLKSIIDYSISTGSSEFKSMGNKAYKYLLGIWDDDIGTVNENKNRKLTDLRSNPDAYHFLILQGINAWHESGSEDAGIKFDKILAFVRKTYEAFTEETMPLMIGYHVAVLAKYESISYRTDVIKPKLESYMKSNLFASNKIIGGYGHRDGLRGIRTDELHMRSAIGLAYAMKAYDYFSKDDYFTKTDKYKNIVSWIDSMKDDEGYHEFQDSKDGVKYGKGSPGQYLPMLWILGTTLK
jgi:hypothetical protein